MDGWMECVGVSVYECVLDIYTLYLSGESYPLGPIILSPGRLSVVAVMSRMFTKVFKKDIRGSDEVWNMRCDGKFFELCLNLHMVNEHCE